MPTISIVIPVYNEDESIRDTILRVRAVTESLSDQFEFELIVVNDGSSDKTPDILSAAEGIILITNPYNIGYGASLKRGIRQASGEWVLIVDADGTYPIEQMLNLLKYIGPWDMVIGQRVSEGDGTSWIRRKSKHFLNWFASKLTHFDIQDINSGMRVFRKDLCMEFWNLYPAGFSFTTTITIAFIRSHYFITYVPITYGKRQGTSSIVPIDFVRFIGIILRIVFYFHPWKLLAPVALLFTASGVIKGIIDIMEHNAVGNLSIFLLICAGLLTLFALIADILFKQRRFQ